MMELTHLLVQLFILHVTSVHTVSIKQLIDQRPELVTLRNYMNGLNLYTQFGQEGSARKYTFFAPSNEAFANVPQSVRDRYSKRPLGSKAKGELSNIMEYHTLYAYQGTEYPLSSLEDNTIHTQASDSAPLFFKKIGGKQYVNGAQIVAADLRASNGYVHIIDHFLYQPAEELNAYSFVEKAVQQSDKAKRTLKFKELLEAYENLVVPSLNNELYTAINHLKDKSKRVTLFIPHDEALRSIDVQRFNNLKSDLELLRKVVESHIIADEAYHQNLLIKLVNQDLPALKGKIRPKRFGKSLIVSNDCAQGTVTNANITVENGVVHLIDGLLGYVYNDLADMLKEKKELEQFSGKVESSQDVYNRLRYEGLGENLPENQMLTVFAPNNEAMKEGELTESGEYFNNALRMHVIEGKLELSQMTNSTVRNTLRGGYEATFTKIETDSEIEIYVMVNNVRGKIIKGDVCTMNGIIHTVDHIIGTPTDTFYSFLKRTSYLTDLREMVSNVGLTTYLDTYSTGRQITLFAANNSAFELMRKGDLGRQLMSNEHVWNLRNVLNRHIVETESIVLADLRQGDKRITTKFGDDITVRRTGNQYIILFASQQVKILRADMRMKNGMMHVIDQVLYDEGNPKAGEWTSSKAAVTLISTAIYVLIITNTFVSLCL